LPPGKTVSSYFYTWRDQGIGEQVHASLRQSIRVLDGCEPTPSAGILDSQSVQTTEAGGPKGYDGGKNRWPCKRHLFVDTLGLIGGLAVLSAASTDWEGTVEVFRRAGQSLPHLAKVWADAAYGVWALLDWIQGHGRWVLEIGNKRSGQTTFEVHKWRWIVERTFGWFNRYRRLSKDYEHNPKSSETGFISPWSIACRVSNYRTRTETMIC